MKTVLYFDGGNYIDQSIIATSKDYKELEDVKPRMPSAMLRG